MRPSHFVALPLWRTVETVSKVSELLTTLELPFERQQANQPTRCAPTVAAASIHLTVGVCNLAKAEGGPLPSIADALRVIEGCREELAKATGGLGHRVRFERIGHFPEQAKPQRARVLFLDPSDAPDQATTLLDLARLVNERLKSAGLLNTGRPNQLNVRATLKHS